MKNLFLATMLVLISGATIYAQSDDMTPQFGVKGGVNIASLSGDDVDVDARTSFNLGLFMELPLSERFSFQPEVLYSGQGFTVIKDNPVGKDLEYQLSYIQVPLMAKFYLVKGLYAEAGPQFGFKVKEKVDVKGGSDNGGVIIDPDDSSVKGFDTNIALGTGYKFDNGLSLSARYTHGLTSIFKEDKVLGNPDVKNSVWQFGLGFSF